MSNRQECGRVARAAALALSAIFVLPSCFTFGLWRAGRSSNGESFAISLAETEKAAGPPRLVCRCGPIPDADPDRAVHERALADVCALWQPPLATGAWLAVEPIEHADVAASLWRKMPQQCVLHIVRGEDGGAPRCWFLCTASSLPHPGNIPDGFERLPGVHAQFGVPGIRVLVFEAECRIAPIAAPEVVPTGAIALQPCNPPPNTAARLRFTPLTLAIDTLMLRYSPICELIGVLAWW